MYTVFYIHVHTLWVWSILPYTHALLAATIHTTIDVYGDYYILQFDMKVCFHFPLGRWGGPQR